MLGLPAVCERFQIRDRGLHHHVRQGVHPLLHRMQQELLPVLAVHIHAESSVHRLQNNVLSRILPAGGDLFGQYKL